MTPDEYRLKAIEKRLDDLERAEPRVLVERVAGLANRQIEYEKSTKDKFAEQQDEISGLRKAIIAAAITVAVSSLITASTVYVVFG